MTLIYSLLTLLAGVGLPIQVTLNHLVAKHSTILWASAIAFGAGTITILMVILTMRQTAPSIQALSSVPTYAWTSGLIAAFTIYITTIAVAEIGTAALATLIVTGQLIASMLLDHYGFAGLQQQPISPGRLAGAALLIAGVILIKRY